MKNDVTYPPAPPFPISNILLTDLQNLYRREGGVAARAGNPSLDTATIPSELSQLLEAAQYLKPALDVDQFQIHDLAAEAVRTLSA